MDEVISTLKVVRVRDGGRGLYLTAEGPNKVSLRDYSKAAEWRVWRLGYGTCYLESKSSKVLAISNDEPAKLDDDVLTTDYLKIIIDMSSISNNRFNAKLQSANDGTNFLIPKEFIFRNKNSVMRTFYGKYVGSASYPWTVEVVEYDDEQIKLRRKEHAAANTIWQQAVGQMVVYVNGSDSGGGGNGFAHCNSGHNVNGSGTQTCGDVNVRTQIGRQTGASVYFTNHFDS